MDYQQQVCSHCGKPFSATSLFCSGCGNRVQLNDISPQANIFHNQPVKPPPGLTKKQFIKDYTQEFDYNLLTVAIITDVTCVCAVFSFIICFLTGTFLSFPIIIISIIEFLIMLGLTLGLHIKKSYGCAIALFVSSIVFSIIVILAGFFSFFSLYNVAGIIAIVTVAKINKKYKQYLLETSVPQPVNNQQFNNYNNRQN